MNSLVTELPVLRVYIDETGDRGFGPKASKIFGVVAVVVPDEHDLALRETVVRLRADFNIADVALHWVKHCGPKDHDRRRHVARLLGEVPGVQLIYAVVDKATVPADAPMRSDQSNAYNFVARLVLERVALSANDWPGGRRRAITRVSHIRGHDHPELLRYICEQCPLEPNSRWIPWELVRASVAIESPTKILGLQAADMYAGIFNAALWPDRYGHCYAAHLLAVSHQLRRAPDGRILRYGIKVLGEELLITNQRWWPELSGRLAA